ncbi:leucine-rich alpha-2-glycoprotein-like [Chelmon rostratus]|uniref:leucine-rich alpha-2-glycoprotein-like n=1 Tax=Chelmon rostratus TaxID=109905 RepID=UPI001BE958B4|nr:leucine-rich alpha-2-glycoprotein-like [Chelmon rostratus]
MKHRRSSALPFSALKMNLWILLTITSLAECRYLKRAAQSCPDLCSCSFPPSGADVVCSRSSLQQFPVDGLDPNTTRLSIQSSNLSSITASHLSAVPLLNNLQLYHSNLTSLPSDLLKDVPHLNMLDLTGNRLVQLPPNVFSHASLHSLVLKNNLIEKADAEWFSGNSSLTWLDLSGNRLTGVPASLLHKLPNLETLDLSDNNLQDLQPDALSNLHRLESLNLAGNKLSSLTTTIFSHNLKLSQLFLQENQLRELPATLLQGLHNLELLLLNQNQLQHFPSGLLDGRKSSFQMALTGNPWVCDEGMEYLWKWLTVHPQNVFFLEEVTCAGPGALKHRQVVSLTDTELGLQKIQN